MTPITRVAPDVGWLPISFVNVYFLGHPGGPWVLIDTGLPGRASQIIRAAAARFGAESKPEAIVLTHGHFDHAGSAATLAETWDVPVYAHRMEMPYLTGRSAYPPPDPTIGGAIAFLSRFMPHGPRNLETRLLPLDGKALPGLPDWEWIATPGHSPGHVSFFRSADRILIAGDAFASMDMDSWSGLLTGKQVLARAGAPFNSDWDATRLSVNRLANLRPEVAACGHGIPLTEPDVAIRLERFSARFHAPSHGRYIRRPARTDESGIVSLPKAPFDPVPVATAASLFVMGVALGAGYLDEKRRR